MLLHETARLHEVIRKPREHGALSSCQALIRLLQEISEEGVGQLVLMLEHPQGSGSVRPIRQLEIFR
ncbi:hypothetical protein D3C73_1602830 [compost metagenome]